MATVTQRSPAPTRSQAPVAAPPPAAPESAPTGKAHPGDRFAMLLWAGCVAIMALMAMLDFVLGLFR